MKDKRQIIPVAGLTVTAAMSMYMVVQLRAQATQGDFSNAAVAEVQDAQGQVILRGQFAPVEEDDDDVERKARLEPSGGNANASGEAEVEFDKATPTDQEVEFSVEHLEPGARITFVIDGRQVGQATVDRRGRAELEVDFSSNATPQSR